jgi:hypothetical protein
MSVPINLGELDDQIQRLQKIRELMSDPHAVALMRELLAGNGCLPAIAGASALAPAQQSGKGRARHRLKRGGQIRAIRKAILGFGDKDLFTVASLGDALRGAGLNISNIAVGKVLRRMQGRGEIEVVEQGKGSAPNIYQRGVQEKTKA